MKIVTWLVFFVTTFSSNAVFAIPHKTVELKFDDDNCASWHGVINEPQFFNFNIDSPKLLIVNKAEHFYYLLPPSLYSMHGEDGFFLNDGNVRWFLQEKGGYHIIIEGGYGVEDSFRVCLE